MNTAIISTKEIRNDLVGFLRQLQNGRVYQVTHRSKPLVRVAAVEQKNFTAADAGSHEAIMRSIALADSVSGRKPVLDPAKSIKQLYDETR